MTLSVHLTPAPFERVEFSLAQVRNVPAESGCYVLASFDGSILYIGKAEELSRRLSNHRKDPRKNAMTPAGKVWWFYYVTCPLGEMSAIEGGWLYEFKAANGGELPHFNKINAPL